MLVYLHGSGERGRSPAELDEAWGLPRLLAAGMELPLPVVSPVCPVREIWTPALIATFLAGLRRRPEAARIRLMLVGYSMGATGVYAYLSEPAAEVAAAVVVAGRIRAFRADRIARTPLLAIYGDADERFAESRIPERLSEVRAAGGRVDLEVIPGAGHEITDQAFGGRGFISWITGIVRQAGFHHGTDRP